MYQPSGFLFLFFVVVVAADVVDVDAVGVVMPSFSRAFATACVMRGWYTFSKLWGNDAVILSAMFVGGPPSTYTAMQRSENA